MSMPDSANIFQGYIYIYLNNRYFAKYNQNESAIVLICLYVNRRVEAFSAIWHPKISEIKQKYHVKL